MEDFKGQLKGQNIEQYILAGNATITIRSAKTGTRFTYKIRAAKDGPVHFVSLLRGSDNDGDFSYIGFIRAGAFFHGGAKSRASKEAPSVIAFGWTWKNRGQLDGKVEVWHEGRCGRCGRKLTVPESVERGLGPECSGEGYKPKAKPVRKAPETAKPVAATRKIGVLSAGMSLSELRTAVKNTLEGKCPDGCCGGEDGRVATEAEIEAELDRIEAQEAERERYKDALDNDAEMARIEAEGDRAQTERDEAAKWAARAAMEKAS